MAASSGVSLPDDLPESFNTALGMLYGIGAVLLFAYMWLTPWSQYSENYIGGCYVSVCLLGEMVLFIGAGTTHRSMRKRLDTGSDWIRQLGNIGPLLSVVGLPMAAIPGFAFTVHVFGFLVTLGCVLAGTSYMAYDNIVGN